MVLAVQFVFGLEQRKTWQVLIFAEEFTKLVEDKTVRQEILSILGTMLFEWFLNLTKHEPETILERLRHGRRLDAVENGGNVRCVFVVLVETQFL